MLISRYELASKSSHEISLNMAVELLEAVGHKAHEARKSLAHGDIIRTPYALYTPVNARPKPNPDADYLPRVKYHVQKLWA